MPPSSKLTPPTIRTVAILGGTGTLGKHMVKAFLDASPKFEKIVVTTRSESSASSLPKGVEPRIVTDYNDLKQLEEALKGVDCVVSCVASDSVGTQAAWAPALAAAGIKLFFPSEYGITENEEEAELADNYYNASRRKFLEACKANGIPTVRFCPGWFGEYLDVPPLYTVDIEKGTVEINGDGNAAVTWTYQEDVAAGVANLVSDPAKWWDRTNQDGYWEVGVAGDDRTMNETTALIEKYSGGWFVQRAGPLPLGNDSLLIF